MIDLSIIIVNWNTRDLLAQCLQSVYNTVQGLEFEVFVVDNASIDGSVAMVRERFSQASLVENTKNVGFARANNQAIKKSRGRYILLLNSDTVIRAGAMYKIVEFMDVHPAAGAAGGKLLNVDGTLQYSCRPFITLYNQFYSMTFFDRVLPRRWILRDYDMDSWDMVVAREVDMVSGACLVVRREAVDQIGYLDEDFFMYGEEADWCYRLKRHGWKIYFVPQAEVIHLGGKSSRQAQCDMLLQLYKSKMLFFRKHHGPLSSKLMKAVFLIGSLLRLTLGSLTYILDKGEKKKLKLKCCCKLLKALPTF